VVLLEMVDQDNFTTLWVLDAGVKLAPRTPA